MLLLYTETSDLISSLKSKMEREEPIERDLLRLKVRYSFEFVEVPLQMYHFLTTEEGSSFGYFLNPENYCRYIYSIEPSSRRSKTVRKFTRLETNCNADVGELFETRSR